VASRGRHTRSTPQLPLATPEVDPEKIIKRRKTLQEGTLAAEPGNFDDFHHPLIETPVVVSHIPITPPVGASRSLNFGSFLVDFPSPSFTTPPPVIVVDFVERETSIPSSPMDFSSNPLLFPFLPGNTPPPPPGSPPAIIPMVGANPPRNRMDAIVAARYAPLILPQPMNALPVGDYLKYMPKFTGEEDITIEEHLVAFYSYADNLNIENEDVWMRVFVQSLDGEARKWFRELTTGSIVGIEALDDIFLRQWGDKKDFMYYITEFGSLRRKEGESVSDFSKRFNKMYNKIHAKIKPTEASAKITYASSFDHDFCLMLRDRRATSLAHMQDAALEVDSNVLAVDRLRIKLTEIEEEGDLKLQPQVPLHAILK
jgi:hypothetical protein